MWAGAKWMERGLGCALVLLVAACGGGETTPSGPAQDTPAFQGGLPSGMDFSGTGGTAAPGATGGTTGFPPSTSAGTAGPLPGSGGGGAAGFGPDEQPSGGTGSEAMPPSAVEPGSFCDVQAIMETGCQSCHGDPLRSAPMPLITHEDLIAPARTDSTKAVYELVVERIRSDSRPMPPGQQNRLPEEQLASIEAWVAAGAPPPDGECAPPDEGGGTTWGGLTVGEDGNLCEGEDAYKPLVAREGETCYEFRTHGGQTPGDTSKYMVGLGEHYSQFYFEVPWPANSYATRMGADFDNVQVLHHWLMFTSQMSASRDGQHDDNVTGTQIGDTAELIGGWAVGGCNIEYPEHMALELPPPGSLLNIQWHFYNYTEEIQPDGTAVQVCVVPEGTRPNVGSITWLGTENIGTAGIGLVDPLPPGWEGEVSGTCLNDSGGPIHIEVFWPHMHNIGRNMRAIVHRNDGTDEEVFNKPFDFNQQIHYMNPVTLEAGESITSYCRYENNSDLLVAFGQSSEQEMCYNFAFSWPAHALDNGVASLIGATNTCW